MHRALLWNILSQQAIEILAKSQVHITATLPTCKGSHKEATALQRFIDQGMATELLAVVVGQRLNLGFKGLERANDPLSQQGSRLV